MARGVKRFTFDIAVLVRVLHMCFFGDVICLTTYLVQRAATRETAIKAHGLNLPVDALHE